MKLTVIIVNYNVKFYVEQCLYSLRKALTGIDAEICVVDNCSNDGCIDHLRPRFDDVVFIQNQENLGFSRANNIAIRRSQTKYVLLLNPHTMVGEDTIRQTIAFMDSHERAGAL
uniref:glycosyltransferase n=1 Tax=Prevotella sp. TaxID=59823 RepID=UPI0040255DE8